MLRVALPAARGLPAVHKVGKEGDEPPRAFGLVSYGAAARNTGTAPSTHAPRWRAGKEGFAFKISDLSTAVSIQAYQDWAAAGTLLHFPLLHIYDSLIHPGFCMGGCMREHI